MLVFFRYKAPIHNLELLHKHALLSETSAILLSKQALQKIGIFKETMHVVVVEPCTYVMQSYKKSVILQFTVHFALPFYKCIPAEIFLRG
ncbi:hypothetical protein XELAEV_18024106mg [Xenopus laevis]|uniref:Uncharacterized protein n=1 Tax=Xenopus laevis TaxID=8355 RepID=A0A974HPQ7_XENLA|nr:hypothetical protein XELAEV_18024106mg [Xenopus laevis]